MIEGDLGDCPKRSNGARASDNILKLIPDKVLLILRHTISLLPNEAVRVHLEIKELFSYKFCHDSLSEKNDKLAYNRETAHNATEHVFLTYKEFS